MDLPSLEHRALELAKQGDFGDEAVRVNAAIVELAPRNAAALKRLGRCHLEERHFDEAVDALRAALALNPTDTVATNLLNEVRRRRALTPKVAERAATGFTAREFDALETLPPGEAALRLASRIDALIGALNGSAIAERVVETRRGLGAAADRLFEAAAQVGGPGRLYLHQPDGRFDPQLRLEWFAPPALARRAFCAGLGFDLASTADAEPAHRAFERFQQALSASWQRPLADWMAANGGFVQWGPGGPALDLEPTRAVDALVTPASREADGWVFVGRWWFLDRASDAALLADRARLARLVDDVFRTLLPLWLSACGSGD